MRIQHLGAPATLIAVLTIGSAVPVAAQPTEPLRSTTNPFAGDRQAITDGAVLFRQECVFCHGVGARGGMRGPDLTTGSWNHGGTDFDVANTIKTGVPGTAMPPNNLKEDEIWQLVSYLRTLEQRPASTAGDQKRGEGLFFGEARCANCHIVNGRGGRLGPELSAIGSARSRAYLVDSIRQPGRQLTRNRSFGDITLKYDTVTAVTNDGRTIIGVPMNEDTFTVQLMDTSERIHTLDKKSLKSLRHEDRSLMPTYEPARLSDADLDDVVAYLQTLRSVSPSAKKGSDHENR
jgi:cytochrome c oxidase cbb3-type subunit 3